MRSRTDGPPRGPPPPPGPPPPRGPPPPPAPPSHRESGGSGAVGGGLHPYRDALGTSVALVARVGVALGGPAGWGVTRQGCPQGAQLLLLGDEDGGRAAAGAERGCGGEHGAAPRGTRPRCLCHHAPGDERVSGGHRWGTGGTTAPVAGQWVIARGVASGCGSPCKGGPQGAGPRVRGVPKMRVPMGCGCPCEGCPQGV